MASNVTITLGGTYSVSGGTTTVLSSLYGQSSDGSPALWQDRTNTALRPGLFPEWTLSVKQATASSPFRIRNKVTLPKVDTLINPELPMLVSTGFVNSEVVIPIEFSLADRTKLYEMTIETLRSAIFKTVTQNLLPVI